MRSVNMAKHKLYTVSQKKPAKSFLSELRQLSTNFDNFWQTDGEEATNYVRCTHLVIFHLNSGHHTTVLNADVPNC